MRHPAVCIHCVRAIERILRFMAVALFLLLTSWPQNLHAEYWATSKLTRFGVEFRYPSSFRRVKGIWEQPGFQGSISALNADTITDGSMSVTLEGTPAFDRDTFEANWRNEVESFGAWISYQVKKDNWYVVSGVQPDGQEFYRKVWLLPHGYGFIFNAIYPESLGETYEPILEQMLKGFKPVFTDG